MQRKKLEFLSISAHLPRSVSLYKDARRLLRDGRAGCSMGWARDDARSSVFLNTTKKALEEVSEEWKW